MTFPTTPVLDDFNRADADSIGGNWTQMMRTGVYDFGIDSNQADNPDNSYQAMYYDALTYGADCEVYVTISTLPPTDDLINIYFRMKDVTADSWIFDGYNVLAYRFDNAGTDTMILKIARVDNSVSTDLGASVNITDHGNGDKLGTQIIGLNIELFYDDGAGWESRMSRSDSTYSAAGYFAVYTQDSTIRWDNFGGGTFNPVPRIMHHRKQGR